MIMSLKTRTNGFSLIEVLVAILISAIGIMGLLALQSRAQQSQMESMQRSQALVLLNEMVNRMRANPDARQCYNITNIAGAGWMGQADGTAPGCVGFGSALNRATAVQDLTDWQNLLNGASEQLAMAGNPNAGAMIGARGCIRYIPPAVGANDSFRVTVVWQGLYPTSTPAEACANAEFGATTQRRAVSTTIEYGNS